MARFELSIEARVKGKWALGWPAVAIIKMPFLPVRWKAAAVNFLFRRFFRLEYRTHPGDGQWRTAELTRKKLIEVENGQPA